VPHSHVPPLIPVVQSILLEEHFIYFLSTLCTPSILSNCLQVVFWMLL
jgi:hypothetical protein